jgi:hypothetical protein
MVAQGFGAPFLGLPLRLEGHECLAANPLHDPAGETAIGIVVYHIQVSFDDLKLHAGRTAIKNEYVHGFPRNTKWVNASI